MAEEMETSLTLPESSTLTREFAAVKNFQSLVRSQMIEGHDYGVIPGTGTKPTLLKPGAEKIAKLLGLSDEYLIINSVENWDRPLFRYLIKCSLRSVRTGVLVSEGLGECNSMEAKYRWRESQRKCPACGKEAIIKGKEEYGGGWVCFKKKGGCGSTFKDGDQSIESQTVGRVENDDIYTQVNTILKMSKKRALVDASLSAGRLSDIFTQDLEDIRGDVAVEPPTQTAQKPQGAPKNGQVIESSAKDESRVFKTLGDVWKACYTEFGMQPADCLKELGVETYKDVTITPAEAYAYIKKVKETIIA